MHRTVFTLAILFSASQIAPAQDILKPLQTLVEDLLPGPTTERRVEPVRPAPVEARPAATEEVDAPPLPRPRPDGVMEKEAEPDVIETVTEDAEQPAPERIYQTACPALFNGRLVGAMLPPIEDGMCTERSPLLVTALQINGREIGLSSAVTTNCAMATALIDWAGEVDNYAKAAMESRISTLNTGSSMMCRNRVGTDNAFMSEHGFANALDIMGATLEDGRLVSIERDWVPANTAEGRFLRQAHGAACGRFTTVLGPDANAEHHDHLHVDLGCHGQTCMAQICE